MNTPRRLPRRLAVALLASVCFLLAGSLSAQETGALRGRVADTLGTSLPRASVRIDALDRSTLTDERGEFYLANVPAGSHRVTASFLGYADASRQVDVRAGDAATLEFALGTDAIKLDQFVVEGTREGQARALTQQKNAVNLMTVVSSDAVGKFPDAYVGDALRRLVGVVVEEDQGEANGVIIRGIEPDYNNITINGVEVAATNTPGGGTSNVASRPVSLDIFSVDLIESIEVAKATTPDMDGAGLGGAVNVKTKTAFSRGVREITASGDYTYAELGDGREGYRGTVSYSDVFGPRKQFGALLAVTREERERRVEKVYPMQYSSAGVLQRGRANGYNQTLTRNSFMGNFDYKVAPGSVVSLKSSYSNYDDASDYDRAQIHADQRRYQNEYVRDHRKKTLYTLDLSADTRFGNNSIRVGGVYSYSEEDKPENQKHVFRTANNAIDVVFNQDDPISPYPILSSFSAGNGVPTTAAEKALFTLNEAKFRGNYQEDKRWTWFADYKRDFSIRSYPAKLKLGVKWTETDRFDNAWSYVFSAGSTVLNYNDFPALPSTRIQDRWNVFVLDKARMLSLFQGSTRDAVFRYRPQDSVSDCIVEDFSAKESVTAYYGSLSLDLKRLRLEGGARFERAEGSFTNYGYDETAYGALPATGTFVGLGVDPVSPYPNVLKVVPGSGSFNAFLPSLHARYLAAPNLVVHSAISTNVGRPKFTDVAGLASFRAVANPDGTSFRLQTGNPDLKAAKSLNLDLTCSYYGLKPLGLFEAGVFYKTIEGRVYREVTARPATQQDVDRYKTATNGLDVGDLIQVISRGNADTSIIYGVEGDWRMELTFLPAPFRGFGLGANYTYTESQETIPHIRSLPVNNPAQPARAGQKVAFPKQPRNSGNGYISFKQWGLDARFAANYTSRMLVSWNDSNALSDQYLRRRWRLDVICSYVFNRRWSITASVINLNDDPAVLYSPPFFPINSEFYGRTVRLGARYFFR